MKNTLINRAVTKRIAIYGSIKGIAGSAVQDVPALELGGGVEEEGEKENLLKRVLPKRKE